MKTIMLGIITLISIVPSFGQLPCSTTEYNADYSRNAANAVRLKAAEEFIQQSGTDRSIASRTEAIKVIRIPVVVHVLYHFPEENISEARIHSQIEALNRDFRKRNADTSKIPAAFKSLAADIEIEFELAKVDPTGRATTGIIRKYTPILSWNTNDAIKSSAQMGDDAWDAGSYLNIWVGNLHRLLGYASFPGADPVVDGIVLSNAIVGKGTARIAAHEVGHWLGLRHLWGDEECGDDMVHDTPKQRGFTSGCPSGIRISCGNAPTGDMYMNYMDFTNGECIYMFTTGQKQRMRSFFAAGGARHSLLSSNGLGTPTIEEIPLPANPPKWLHVKTYPNPAVSTITINFEYDARWIGNTLRVLNSHGQVVIAQKISGTLQKIDVSKLHPGLYFISGEREGDRVREKFVKQ